MSSSMTSSHEPTTTTTTTTTMTMTTTTMAEAELDSDGSSCGERDTWKRVRGDPADLGIGTKKRRKQATPVRFSSSIAIGLHEDACEDEREDENSEGKPSSRSPLPSNEHHHLQQQHHHHHHHHQPSLKDENLNNEFRCQHCGRFFDSDETLSVHVDDEHGDVNQATTGVTVKVEPAQQLDQTNDGPVSLLSVKNFATTWLAPGSQQQQHVQSQTQMQSQTEESWSGGPVNQIVTMTNHLQALSGFPGALAQYLPLPGFPLPDPQQVSRSSLGPVPVKIFNPDAYCDMCNKEFCNKYFLKTHKANKHGIYVDSPAPSTAIDATNVFGTVNFHAGNTNVKLEPSTTPPQKRFRNEESAIKKHKQKNESLMDQQSDSQQISLSQKEEDRETLRDSPSGMEALLKQEYGIEQEDATFMPAPRHLSPQSIQQARDSGFSADLLRRLGVINPEAFCEICCKEYCNKYFLRTHKMKRHGIIVQDNEKSAGDPGTAATWHQVQTSPLNLIVTDSTGAYSESNDRISEEYECKSCGIRFQTIGLYQTHCKKIHESEDRGTPKQEYDLENSDQRTDSISEDLQKLQTMIMQLNGLDSGKGLSCAVCGKECDSRSALRVHMATEHGVGNDEISSPQETSPTQIISNVFCTLCDKDYPSQEALRRHISEEHQPVVSSVITLPTLPPTIVASSASSTPTNQTPNSQMTPTTTATAATMTTTAEKKMTSLTPTSSYCEICNKELCNKYFMKTHMQRMHGIEIENGAQIGGVICNICNKELCSKYFLRVHKHNTHGIVDENASSASTSNKQEPYDAPGPEDSVLKQELGDLSHKYFIHFTEVCPICSRRFRSIKWLKAHLMGDHGKVGIDKWREMEQQSQETPRSSGKSVTPVKNIQQTPNLKIPNGFEIVQQAKSTDCTNLGNQVLSNFFGSSSEEHQVKNYRCAYCNFATSVLPLLFLHERSHISFQENVEGDRPLQCPICFQDFHQSELLHQHLLAKHQIPTLFSQFQHPFLNNLRSDVDVKASDVTKNKIDQDTKDNRAGCNPQIDQNIPEPAKNQRQDETVQVTAHGAYKCAQCGYATTNLNRIKKHVRKDHKLIGDPTESVIAELTKTLKDVANKQKVPACYAMPQDMNSNPDKTIMQPFLIEEQDLMQAGAESSSAKRFAPALVYLPVKSRISNALSASFTLTPA